MSLVVGVDSSTTATKVQFRETESGELVAAGRSPHPPTSPPRSEQDPEAWWLALRDALAIAWRSGRSGSGRPATLSVAAQQHGLVALDEAGAPVWPAKLWNDTESAPDAAALLDRLGGAEPWAASCGSVPVAAFTITKLAWLRRCHPGAFSRIHRVLLPHDWLNWRLVGRAMTDRGDASGTGYWSPTEGGWRPDLLALVDASVSWDERLPELLAPSEAAGQLGPAAAEVGLPRATTAGPGTGDNMAAALGLGLRPGDVVVSIGTSGTVFAMSETQTADESGAVAGFADATGQYLPLVCTLNATKVTDAFVRLLGVDHDGFDRLVLSEPPGAGCLVLLPYLDGERTPNRPGAAGILSGLRPDTGASQIARAAVEGVVCGLLDGLDALVAAGVGVGGRLLLTGGGARSGAYRQVLADLSGRPVVVLREEELVARGACVQAAAVAGGVSVDDVLAAWASPPADTVDPVADPDQGKAVRERYRLLRDVSGPLARDGRPG